MKEQKQYLSLLEQLKDYDEELAQGLAARAFQEQERQRLEVFSFYNIHAAFRLEKTRIKGSLFPFQGRSMVVWLFQYSIFAKLHLLQQNCICCRQECWVGWGMGEGGGGGVRDEVWGRETILSQLAKRSPCVVVIGYLQYFSQVKREANPQRL